MVCPKCGFMMDAFDRECPRCHGKGIEKTSAVAPQPARPAAASVNSGVTASINSGDDSATTLFGYGFLSALLPLIGLIVGLLMLSKNPQRGRACLIGSVIGLVIGTRLLGSLSAPVAPVGYSTYSAFSPSAYTMAQYNSIQTGMSYAQVTQIMGDGGREVSRSEMAGFTTVMYAWQNPGGANMNVMLQNDKVVQKAQLGLQ